MVRFCARPTVVFSFLPPPPFSAHPARFSRPVPALRRAAPALPNPQTAGGWGHFGRGGAAGCRPEQVTGDNIVTATSIAMKAGILSHGGIAMEGPDFRKMHEEHLAFYARLAARETADDDEPGAGVSVDFAQEKYLSPVGSQSAIPTSPGGELPDRTAKRKTRGWIDLVLRSDVSEQADGQHQQQARNAEKARLSAFDKMLPKLRVLARSSPTDKQILVEHLKSLGETVAVTGDGANDGPALKTADVGFAMGIAGSGIAKEAASIILMDDNFCSVVTAVVWGRSVSDSVRKFLTFQLTVNVTAVTLALDESSTSVLTAVQLLWVNLLMDTFGALALATDEPDEDEFMRRPPINNKRDPLISWNMRWMIAGQALWQTSVTLVLLYAGSSLFQLRNEDKQQHLQLRTIVFNAFVLCNLCNEVNARRIDKRFDIFGGIHKNPTFIAIVAGTLVVQFLIVHFGGEAFRTAPITAGQWAICVFVAVISLPLGILVRILFFRATPLAKPVRVGVYPTINPSWKRELLWRRAVRMALRQKSFGVDDRCADAGMTERDDEHGQHNNGDTMTIELPTPVYNRLRDALESKTSGAQSHSQKVGHRRSQTGTLFESVVAGIIAKNDREKAAEKGGGGGGGGEGENKEAAGRST
ncbi:MAG: hypothetical protein BJ554DRAFT_586 [Olpidium bornovanus]|uniref:Cation-transporting P-type ATPase C-terminal domain-containing protein n=1 Tax=Olpidium bornovanus TaxID=278681 RepID=A0A8H8A1K6_9FUNG|nr:MAG: hypothetical protein BJ554DRAFT_586 [Olpidium bornovanus]